MKAQVGDQVMYLCGLSYRVDLVSKVEQDNGWDLVYTEGGDVVPADSVVEVYKWSFE